MRPIAFVARPAGALLRARPPFAASTHPLRRPPPALPPARTRPLATASPSPPAAPPPAPRPAGGLTLLYDGECPLCLREVRFLRGRSDLRTPPPLRFVDIAARDYSPAAHAGVDYATAMGRIHGVTAGGDVVVGVPVFRLAYAAVGLGWVYRATEVPGVGRVADWVYGLWAERRLQWTGRRPLGEILEERKRSCR